MAWKARFSNNIRRCASAFVDGDETDNIMMWIRQSDIARGLFALLLLCALSIRIVVPAGYMPAQGLSGIIVTLCTGQGAVKAFLPIEQEDDQPVNHEKTDPPCAFAVGLGGGLLDASSHSLAAPFVLHAILVSRAIPYLTVNRLAAPPPPAQAPPARR